MNDPLISVIVPVYKTQQYLDRCVSSIRNQTYKNLEIILVDDGSPDRSGEICDSFALEDSRIRVVHKENGGLSSARNAGLDVMTGEYVVCVDSDDDIALDMIETLYGLCVTHGAQIACGGVEKVNDQGHVGYFNENLTDFLLLTREEALRELLENQRILNSLWDKLYHKSIFDGIRMTKGILYEDCDIMYLCMQKAERVVYTGKPLYHYYLSQGSILRATFNARRFDLIRVLRKRMAFYQQEYPQLMDIVRAKYVDLGLEILYQSRNAKDCLDLRKELADEIRRMLREYPNLPMTRNNRIKVVFFRMGMPIFVAFISVFHRLRGTQR